MGSELSEHEKLIDKMVSADFTKYITEDLNRPLEDTETLLEEVSIILGYSCNIMSNCFHDTDILLCITAVNLIIPLFSGPINCCSIWCAAATKI